MAKKPEHQPTDSIHCSRCGKLVSSPVPAGTIVRAFIECPECVEKQARPIRDSALIGHAVAAMIRNWPENSSEPHYVNLISESCGWRHMEPGEKISVGFGGGRFEIKRTE